MGLNIFMYLENTHIAKYVVVAAHIYWSKYVDLEHVHTSLNIYMVESKIHFRQNTQN